MAAEDNRCRYCGRPVDLDEPSWKIFWDRKQRWRGVWWECPDHTYEQLKLF